MYSIVKGGIVMKKTLLALAALTALGITSVMAAPVSYQSVLTGKVASTVSVGTSVTEGQTLVTVGSDISRDQVVVTVESK